MINAHDQFKAAMRAARLEPPDVILADNTLHRFPTNGRSGDDAGWYIYYADAIPAGAFGDWRTGLSQTWRADIGRELTGAEQAACRTKIEAAKRQREAEETKRHANAATGAAGIWKAAQLAGTDHPYLVRKGVKPVPTLREIPVERTAAILGYVPKAKGEALTGRLLVVPVKIGDRLSTLEFIDETGRKSALAGGAKSGGYWAVQSLPEGDGTGLTLLIGEGVATILSAREATERPAIAALSSSNLESVARVMREKYRAATLVILADSGNGQDKALEAARAVGGLLAIPNFGEHKPEGAKDFNDLHQERGAEAVRRAVANAKAAGITEAQAGKQSAGATSKNGLSLLFRRLSDVQTKPIRWLWPARLARGKVSILAGHPGLGKSQVSLSIAAIVSTGGTWPVDRTRCELGSVVILSAEDDAEDTIRPRLEAAGADLSRCYILDAVQQVNEKGERMQRAFCLQTDLSRLEELLGKLGDVALVIIDPVTAYLGEADSHKNAEIRALLSPLGELAARCGAAVLCVSHLTKGGSSDALMRVTGSLAFVAAARAAYLVAKDQEEPVRRLFLPLKNNLGNDEYGLAFAIQTYRLTNGIEASRVMWEAEAVTVTADEAMAPAEASEEKSALEDAKAFLESLLIGGPVAAKQVRADADGAGYAWRTIQRTQKALGVEAIKEGMKGGWAWRLPAKSAKASEECQEKTLAAFGDVGSLRPNSEPDYEVF